MNEEHLPISRKTIFCFDSNPDSRRRISDQLSSFGYQVMATGNPQIAAGLIQEQNFDVLILSLDCIKISTISILVNARRSRPEMPIGVLLPANCRDVLPPGLVDSIITETDDESIMHSVIKLAELTPTLAQAI
jgi:CheY-like chemotaxis protein